MLRQIGQAITLAAASAAADAAVRWAWEKVAARLDRYGEWRTVE